MSGRPRLVWLIAFCSAALLPPATHGREPDEIQQKTDATIAALAASGIEPSEDDFGPPGDAEPPPEVTAAGDEFVAVWREYRQALALRNAPGTGSPDGAPTRVADEDPQAAAERARRVIAQLVSGNDPPTPEQVDAELVFVDDGSWCGFARVESAMLRQRALLLANLLHRRYGRAVNIALESSISADPNVVKERPALLSALGLDWRRVMAGAWLNGEGEMLEPICADPSEETAQLALGWAKRHWDEAVALEQARRENRYRDPGRQPELPTRALLSLLRSDNGLSDETKARVAAFLNINALRLYDEAFWLADLPAGAANWVQPIAHSGLNHDKNDVRRKAEQALRAAGDRTGTADVRSDPLYRVFIDGELWRPDEAPGWNRSSISIAYTGPGASGMAGPLTPRRDGVIVVDADDFLPLHRIRRASITHLPSSVTDTVWFEAAIPLPPAFGELTDLQVETTALTVRPRLPRPLRRDQTMEIGMASAMDGQPPNPNDMGGQVFRVSGSAPLVLAKLQRGDYWVRIRAPGAALGPWERIHVTGEAMSVAPKLSLGSTVHAPLSWPPGTDLRGKNWRSLDEAFIVERNGAVVAGTIQVALAGDDEDGDEIRFPNLPTGRYHVRFRSDRGWQPAEFSFSVTARTPPELTLPTLRMVAEQ